MVPDEQKVRKADAKRICPIRNIKGLKENVDNSKPTGRNQGL